MRHVRLAVLCIFVSSPLFFAGLGHNVVATQEQFPLNDDGILSMVHEKFDDATIVRM